MKTLFCLLLLTVLPSAAAAQTPPGFHAGTRIPDFGLIAAVSTDRPIRADETFKHAFDVSSAAEPGQINRGIESAARFMNALKEAGAADDNVQVAVVIHGSASQDVLAAPFYARHGGGAKNGNGALIAALLKAGARIELCGQSAAAKRITNDQLLPGVSMALSAMTAHARLQREGYTLNPF